MSKLLLLPSARLVPVELQVDFGAIPSAMVPLGSQPALNYIIKPFVARGYKVIVAVHEGADQVESYLARRKDVPGRAVDVGATRSLGATVANALTGLDRLPDHLVINFADTYVETPPAAENAILYAKRDDVYRWTTFEMGSDGTIREVCEKYQAKEKDRPLPVFVGVFAIADAPAFLERLKGALASGEAEPEIDPFYAALVDYFNDLPAEERLLQKVADWLDFGHLDTYYTAKREVFVNKRFFNRVRIDGARGILRKSSNEEKFLKEVQWYLRIPAELQHFAPRVLNYSLNLEDPFVDIEFYGYPALNDIYLFGGLDPGEWERIFAAIDHAIKEMHTFRLELPQTDRLVRAMHSMYEDKTLSRMQAIFRDRRFAGFCGESVTIDGRACCGLGHVRQALPGLLQSCGIYDLDFFTIIHGDFCLGNILYDRRNSFIRAIDPRGSFGTFDIYGDPRYDLAKLTHSFAGDYDFLLNGLFELAENQEPVGLKVHLEDRHLAIKQQFEIWMARNWPQWVRQIRLIESLLFLSMVPLHKDRFLSQKAFLVRGLQLYTRVAEELADERAAERVEQPARQCFG